MSRQSEFNERLNLRVSGATKRELEARAARKGWPVTATSEARDLIDKGLKAEQTDERGQVAA
jgi:hypothetical protein